MKLFGGKPKNQTKAPPAPPEAARSGQASPVRSEAPAPANAEAPARAKGKNGFRVGYLIYVTLFLAAITAGLVLLWQRMDVYEKSRPGNTMEDYMAFATGDYWRSFLLSRGVDNSFVDTLDLEDAEYSKLLGAYTDETPVYGIRFGGRSMLTVTLKPGAELAFGSHEWEIGSVSLADSGLLVYAPEDAVITVGGEAVDASCLTERNAQPLTLSVFEADRADIPGLAKYQIDDIFGVEKLTVTDRDGNELPLSYSSGNSYYYAPLTFGVTVTAPSAAAVTVNGVLLTEENARIEHSPIEGLEAAVGFVAEVPENRTYYVEGLVAAPAVSAEAAAGTLTAEPAEEGRYVYALAHDAALAAEQRELIETVFDVYAAYSTNQGGDTMNNYYRYLAYLAPGSDAADRAYRALETVVWATGRSAEVTGVTVDRVIRYAADCFTAQVNFTLETDETENENGYLFVFVLQDNAWKVVSVLIL